MEKDLTVGKPGRVLWQFCLPLFGSVIFQQLYNIADSFVAGKFINNDALAAVGNSYEITLIFIAFAFGINIGCSVVTSRLYGEKNLGEMKTAVYTTLIASGFLCVVLMICGWVWGGDLLRLINTPDSLFADSKKYLDIYVLSLPFVFYYNVATGIFSALGDSKTPFIFLACSSVANIGADILFVAAFHMGVPGVAWATLICQGISCVLALLVVFKRFGGIKTDKKAKLFSFKLLKKIAVIAIPSTLQHSFVSVGNIVLQSVINGFGEDVMAGYSAAIKLNNMVVTSLVTIGNGISNYTAQNLGAKKYDRIKSGFKSGVLMVWAISVPLSLIYFIFGRNLVYVFLDSPTGAAVDVGAMFLTIVAPFYITVATKLAADGILRGAGLMVRFMTGTFADLFLRVGLAIVLAKTDLGSTGIWLAWPIGWTISMAMSLMFYKTKRFGETQRA